MLKYYRNQKTFSSLPNVLTNFRLELGFQRVDQHAGAKYIIHGSKHHKGKQFHNVNRKSTGKSFLKIYFSNGVPYN